MSPTAAASERAQACAREVIEAFEHYNAEFRAVTRRAPARFDNRDWQGSQRDAVERIDLYGRYVDTTLAEIQLHLGEDSRSLERWREVKQLFAQHIESMPDAEFRKTFFNSLTRKQFGTIGVAPDSEFVALDLDPLASVRDPVVTSVYQNRGSWELLFEEVLADFRSKAPWRDFERSVATVAQTVRARCAVQGENRALASVEVIRPVFYHTTRAYLVGRMYGPGWTMPLVIALKNTERGVLVDAVMSEEADVSVLFSFTRSYFHVDLERVGEAVLFLKQLLPKKPVSELFTVLGRAHQGKTERYRELFRHLAITTSQFVHAPGERGLVMAVFTLPSFDVVFKVIRDHFPAQKNIVRADVLKKYDFVFKHDRAGRLVDAQEFKRLRVPRDRFAAALLAELSAETRGTVHDDGADLVIDHCYVERRVVPLNLYLREADAEAGESVVLDYGQAIRDLAATNIFAGDFLLKNFGVTRHGRVIFYDYDELCLVTDCRFRELPEATNDEDEMRAETWYYVADNDVFPETFINFLGLDGALKEVFLRAHGELLTAAWWRGVQTRLASEEMLEVLPYAPHRVAVASSA
jgi:isocitrate dehydrogenase kinase/phosphatase